MSTPDVGRRSIRGTTTRDARSIAPTPTPRYGSAVTRGQYRPRISGPDMFRPMAVQTFRTDDLTGERDAVPTTITVNGRGVQLDLAEKSATRLAKALEPFWSVGSESTYDVEKRGRARNGASRGYDLAELRAWAAREGVEIPSRGRIPATVVAQYLRG